MINDAMRDPLHTLRASGGGSATAYQREDSPRRSSRKRGEEGEETIVILYVDKEQVDSEVRRIVCSPLNGGVVESSDAETWCVTFPGVKSAGDSRTRYYRLRDRNTLRYTVSDGIQRLIASNETAVTVWHTMHPTVS